MTDERLKKQKEEREKKKQEEAKQSSVPQPKGGVDDFIKKLIKSTPESIESILNPQAQQEPIQPSTSQQREVSEMRISSFLCEWELVSKPKPVTYEREVQTDPIVFEAPEKQEEKEPYLDNLGLSKKGFNQVQLGLVQSHV